MIDYTKKFDPPLVPEAAPLAGAVRRPRRAAKPAEQFADRAEPAGYVYDEELVLVVNVALATGRPLLLRGRPGTGKSSMARNVAMHLKRRFYPRTISSRTQARDLLWTVDDVTRLSDATSRDKAVADRTHYVQPGVLWWAFHPSSAARRGLPDGQVPSDKLLPDPNEGELGAAEAVVMLDEIDKADPDVPNDLLEPLGLYWFRDVRGEVVKSATAPLVVLTTNEERDLSKAFLRRCVVHTLPLPTRAKLKHIAEVRFGLDTTGLYDGVVQVLAPADTKTAGGESGGGSDDEQVDVSIAEFLDVVVAARELRIRPGHAGWAKVLEATTSKPATSGLG